VNLVDAIYACILSGVSSSPSRRRREIKDAKSRKQL